MKRFSFLSRFFPFLLFFLLTFLCFSSSSAFSEPATSSHVRFAFFADSHYYFPDRPDCDWCKDSHNALVTGLRFIQDALKPEFLVIGGDRIAGEGASRLNETETYALNEKFMLEVSKIITVPVYEAWGNHDGPNFPKIYGYKNKSFTVNGIRFFLLSIDYDNWNAGTGVFSAWEDFKKVMDEDKNMPTIVVIHTPIQPPTFSNALNVKKMFEKYPSVKAVLQGHVHFEKITWIRKILYFTAGKFFNTPERFVYMVDFDGKHIKIIRYTAKSGQYKMDEGVVILDENVK